MVKITENDLDLSIERLKGNISEIVWHVTNNILGRLANKAGDIVLDNTNVMLEFVAKAEGNHLEIGTLFGGSAIAVALLKEELSQKGIVVCVDPLNGYYSKQGSGEDLSGVPITPTTLFHNIDLFDVGNRLLIMKAYSRFCRNLGMTFSTAYIDGDHHGSMPLRDWLRVKDMISRYVIFDNCDMRHVGVVRACTVADDDPEWECVYSSGITYVVERINEL